MRPPQRIAFFVRATRGLEDVVAGELDALAGVRIDAIQHRTVSGSIDGSLSALPSLRSADDAFLELDRFDGMERARAALSLLGERASGVELRPALAAISAVRPLPRDPTLSIAASFVGRRNYTSAELKETLAKAVAWPRRIALEPDDRKAPLHLRLVLEGEQALLGLRVAREPLHERSWKRAHRPGSLKPSVAAALWRLAGLTAGARALDPCCGAGTLVAEASEAGARALGGDRDRAALVAAAANLGALGRPAALARWDARALPLPDASIDTAATNLPWGRQVAAPLEGLYAAAADELARVLVPGGRAVVLTGAPERFRPSGLRLDVRREVGVSGQRASVLVLSRPAERA